MKTHQQIILDRDAKIIPHLNQYAPVWLIDEDFIPADEAVIFHAVFQHNLYGWVKRRYLYDGFNDILYHKGQLAIDEETALELQEKEPFLTVTVDNIPNNYGG